MKSYPSIPYRKQACNKSMIVFDKLDGSNIRAEWSKKQGWYKFGSRNKLIDSSSGFLQEAPGLIKTKYEDLPKVFKKLGYERAIAFFEFFGPSSFAGQHTEEKHDVVLFDIAPYKKGILNASEFLDHFGEFDVPNVLHVGPVNRELLDMVEDGTLHGMTFEGAVFKEKNKSRKPLVFKHKSKQWIERLKVFCNNDEKKINKLL